MSKMSVREVRREPVAIIGAACRLPGAPTVEAFWDMLHTGRDMVTTMSPERRALEVTKPATDTRHIRPAEGQGGFLDRIDAFDAHFFGVSPYEAVRLDPQQRLLLETVWEAVEDAGLTADQLSGTRTGAYTSCFTSHYWNLATAAGMTDMHALLGSSRYSVAAGRIAHLLDLRGPALGVDATCASSLVAVHMACQAIQLGEVDMAIVGGVNLLLCRELDTSAEEAGLLSPTARCRFGDARADGMVRAEGAVTVVLKPLSKAVEDGDRVYATILGSGVASNGRQGQSLTDLGPDGMDDMLRTAYRTAGVSVADLDYVEAHGPGTPEGDISELTALSNFLRARFQDEGRPADQRCLVGSVKSNVGHTETAAGLAGLLKTALALRHRTIPRTLHVRNPNSVFTADGSPIELVRTRQAWPDRGRAPIAGVTSLGMFGMNAHLVLTEGPTVAEETPARQEERALILPLSAKHPTALRQLAAAYADTLENAENPADVCFSAGARRTQHNLRLAVTGADRQAVIDDLREFGSGGRALFPVGTDNRLAGRPRVVFVFPGQGSQWVGMGRELLGCSPVFAGCLAECDRAIAEELGWSVIERLRGDTPLSTLAEIQPALWAIQVGLAAMWRDWGIEPDLIIGHSMGELAAATTAGALTLREGAAAVCRRSTLMTNSTGDGAMWSVHLNETQAQEAIGEYAGKVSVGAVNSDQSVVLSGDATALAAVIAPLREHGVFCRQVRANFASHSPHVEPLLAELRASLADLRPQAGQVPIHSTVLDRVVDGSEFDAEYWVANLRQPVRFASAVQAALAGSANTVVIEISAHPVLTTSVEDGIDAIGANAITLPSVNRDSSEMVSMLDSLATAYTRGCVANWERVTPGRYTPLPSYPWQHKRFWISPGNGNASPAEEPMPVPVAASEPARFVDVDSLTRHIKLQVAEVLSTSPDLIDPTMPLTFSGMDSLLAAKLRARVQQELDLHIPIRDFLSSPSLNHLAHHLAGTRQDS